MHTVMLPGVNWEIRRLTLGLAITGAIFVELNFNGRLLEPIREMPHKTFDMEFIESQSLRENNFLLKLHDDNIKNKTWEFVNESLFLPSNTMIHLL